MMLRHRVRRRNPSSWRRNLKSTRTWRESTLLILVQVVRRITMRTLMGRMRNQNRTLSKVIILTIWTICIYVLMLSEVTPYIFATCRGELSGVKSPSTMDTWVSSVRLFLRLLNEGILCLGTIKTNRVGWPASLSVKSFVAVQGDLL